MSYKCKIVLVGDAAVGKSCLLLRFVDDTFDDEQPATIGVDFKQKQIMIDGQNIRLAIWDTAGQERFRTLTSSYYRGANGVVLAFDSTRRETFASLDYWQEEVKNYTTNPNVVVMLVATKIDLAARQVSREEGMTYARQHGLLYCESSAKTRKGVQQAFEELVRKIMDSPQLRSDLNSGNTTMLSSRAGEEEDLGACAC